MADEKNVTLFLDFGDGKKEIKQMSGNVLLNSLALKRIGNMVKFYIDDIEMSMHKDVYYEMVENIGLSMPPDDRKMVVDALRRSL